MDCRRRKSRCADDPTVVNFDPDALDEWSLVASHGERLAVQLVLNCYNQFHEWRCGRFDVVEAMQVWDSRHRQAFLCVGAESHHHLILPSGDGGACLQPLRRPMIGRGGVRASGGRRRRGRVGCDVEAAALSDLPLSLRAGDADDPLSPPPMVHRRKCGDCGQSFKSVGE